MKGVGHPVLGLVEGVGGDAGFEGVDQLLGFVGRLGDGALVRRAQIGGVHVGLHTQYRKR